MTRLADGSDRAYLTARRTKVVYCKPLTPVTESKTAQPPGSRHSVLRVATYGQQVALLEWGVILLCRGAVGVILQPQPTGLESETDGWLGLWYINLCRLFNVKSISISSNSI